MFLLDTHILVFWIERAGRLSKAELRAIRSASTERPLLISDVSLWEIGMLVERKRLKLTMPLRAWLDRATAPPLVECSRISSSVVDEIARLPMTLPWDPADRVLVATARVRGAKFLTHDDRIRDSGLVTCV